MNRSVVVSKFGGTSMGDYQAMVRSATISLERKASVVVVSATSGTTDRLIEIAKLAGNGSLSECEKLVFNLKERHLTLLSQAGSSDDSASLLQGHFTEMDLLIQNISLLKELTPRAHDHILSLGERMSSLIFRDVMRQMAPSKKVTLIDARSIIKTDSNFGKATPQIDLIHQNISQKMPMSAQMLKATQRF
jgi:aspartate kinase